MSVYYYFQKHLKTLNVLPDNITGSTVYLVNEIMERTSSSRLFFTGVGKNGHVSQMAASTFNSIGISSGFLDPQHAIHGDLGQLCPDDLLIALSKSGETPELLALLTHTHKRMQNTVLIHAHPQNSALALVDKSIYIPVKHEADDLSMIPTTSLVAFLIFLQSVACEIANRQGLTSQTFVFNHPGGTIGKTYSK